MNIAPIVEGHGEVEAVPILIRRISQTLGKTEPQIALPIRCPKNKIIRKNKSGNIEIEKIELERVIKLASLKLTPPGAIILLFDADADCPASMGRQLLDVIKEIRGDIPISVVLSKCEYEAWFLASLSSLSGERGIVLPIDPISDPESISGAKEYLENHCMKKNRSYSETLDQPALTSKFDLNEARKNSPSFDKFWREVERYL